MKLSKLQLRGLDLILAALWVAGAALTIGEPVRAGLAMLTGVLWLALAWRFGLCALLMAFLFFMAVRHSPGDPLSISWMLAVWAGAGAWICSAWFRNTLSAAASGFLWGAMTLLAPPLWLLGLCGLPQLAKLHAEHPKWAVWPGLLLTGIGAGVPLVRGNFLSRMNQLAEAEPYLRIRDVGAEISLQEQLWLILPLVGLFELAQRQTDEHGFNWRSLMVAGGIFSLFLVPDGVAAPLVYTAAFPMCAFMLTRWYLALPDLPSRILVSLALLMQAFPLMNGGIS